jgi:glycosyltransferase 2 family protein
VDDPVAVTAMSRERLIRGIKGLYVILLLGAVGWYVRGLDLEPEVWTAWLMRPGPYLFVAGWAAMAWVLGFAWVLVVHAHLGLRLSARDWLPLQALAWLGRYLPGKIGLLTGKLGLMTSHSVSMRALGFTVLYEQFAFVATGLALAVCMPATALGLGGALAQAWDGALFWRIPSAVLIGACIVPGMRVLRALAGLKGPAAIRQEWPVPLLYLIAHASAGAGLFACLRSLPGIDETGLSMAYVVGLLAAANVAGILAVFAPAGLGVREGVLVAGLAPWLPIPEAVIVAALLRVLSVLGDLGFSAMAWSVSRLLGPPVDPQRQAEGT